MKRLLIAAAMLGLAGGAQAAELGELAAVKAADLKAEAKGYVEPAEYAPSMAWVKIDGGTFLMGSTSMERGFENTRPVRAVAVKTFWMSRTAVTVAQYAECVTKGWCTKPNTGGLCNWGNPGRADDPVNCVDWHQAQAYADFKGARLPTEAEFEYAATGGGKNQKYPWGNEAPTRELAVYRIGSTMPVCSKPAGNTAQGLCDMSGNVWQWVQDVYRDSYIGAPVDGGAVEGDGPNRVVRGGDFYRNAPGYLRADYRNELPAHRRHDMVGIRLAR